MGFDQRLGKGFTTIPHTFLEALARYPLSGGERRVLDVLFRLLYGWHHSSRRIRLTTFAHLTGLHLRYVHRVLLSLEAHGLILRDRRTRPHTYELNAEFWTWRLWSQVKEPEPAPNDDSPDNACALSDDPGQVSRCGPAPWGRLSNKDKKDKDLPPRPADGVDNTPPQLRTLVGNVATALSPTRAPEARHG